MPSASDCSSTCVTRWPATSNAVSGGESGGVTTTGPCSIAAVPARSPRSAPDSRSPSQAPHPATRLAAAGAQAPAKLNRESGASHGADSFSYLTPLSLLLLAKHRVLQRLGEAKLHDALRGDLDGLPRLRVAAHTRLAVGEDETTEVGKDEHVLGFLGGEREELIHHVVDLLLRQRRLLRHVRDDGGLGHRFRHVWSSWSEDVRVSFRVVEGARPRRTDAVLYSSPFPCSTVRLPRGYDCTVVRSGCK